MKFIIFEIDPSSILFQNLFIRNLIWILVFHQNCLALHDWNFIYRAVVWYKCVVFTRRKIIYPIIACVQVLAGHPVCIWCFSVCVSIIYRVLSIKETSIQYMSGITIDALVLSPVGEFRRNLGLSIPKRLKAIPEIFRYKHCSK